MSPDRYTLYIDESGIRYPQHKVMPREDGMDWFSWGGVLVRKQDEQEIVDKYKKFCEKWEITYPLHSSEIRGKRDKFGWLRDDETKTAEFFNDLNDFLTGISVIGFGVVVSRPGYNKKFREKYGNQRWELCKTTHPILMERVVRYLIANSDNPKLKVVFEGASGSDNKKVVNYGMALKDSGHPFDKNNAEKYSPLPCEIFQELVVGRPEPGTKSNIFLQIADLYVYPMSKFIYDPNYLAWHELYKAGRLIDSVLEPEEIYLKGVKYYCFNT
ncbi:MAG: DUF3800 domain-containing protein [Candidatus Paceibacterota bacterium]